LLKSELDSDGGVRVSVSDTGAGISAQDIDRIFNLVFSTKTDGMGMGLSICRSIARRTMAVVAYREHPPRQRISIRPGRPCRYFCSHAVKI